MRYSAIEALLSADEIEAIKVLESRGWEILTETKIEDTFRKDGGRIRTFALSGRYDLAMVLKSVPVRKRAVAETDPPPADDPPGDEETGKGNAPVNFWLDSGNWIRLQKQPFTQAIEDHVNELVEVADEVRDEVHRKFDRFFDPNDWPL